MAYHRQQGVDTAIVRIFNTYGPRMRPNDGRAIPTFVRQALENKPLTVFGDGSQTRSFCYVDDLIRGLVAARRVAASTCPSTSATPSEFTLLELAETVIRDRPARRARSSSRRCRSTTRRCASPDITRARQLLGWEPEVVARGRAAPHASQSLGREPVGCVGGSSSLAAVARSRPRRLPRLRPSASRFVQLGHLRRRADPLRQPRPGVPDAAAAERRR